MTYRLKEIRYGESNVWILLQNENGPCPLLAAANVLLLRGSIVFPSHCIRNGVASLEDVTNMLVNHAMLLLSNASTDSSEDQQQNQHYMDELLQHIPTFQYGMDVNPKFTQGITGYEYTSQLHAFDMLRVKLVHGWLVDPQEDPEVYDVLVGNNNTESNSATYNSLVERIIHGNESSSAIDAVEAEIAKLHEQLEPPQSAPVDLLNDSDPNTSNAATDERIQSLSQKLHELEEKRTKLHLAATQGSLINNFLESTSHQLTHYGLQLLYQELQDDELTVFFRNNHFATLTKQNGLLYLLVTDLGYANTPNIVWEKLDVIDGDTELVNSQFKRAGEQGPETTGPTLTPEQLMAQSGQKDADLQLALQLSAQENGGQVPPPQSSATANTSTTGESLDAQEGKLMAAATEASLRSYHGLADGIPQGQVPPQVPPSTASAAAPRIAVGVPVGAPSTTRVQTTPSGTVARVPPPTNVSLSAQEEADKLFAMQLQAGHTNHEEASLHLARKLQDEENKRAAAARRPPVATTASSGAKDSNCVIS